MCNLQIILEQYEALQLKAIYVLIYQVNTSDENK